MTVTSDLHILKSPTWTEISPPLRSTTPHTHKQTNTHTNTHTRLHTVICSEFRCKQDVGVSPGQSAAFPGPQSALLPPPLRGNELRTVGRANRTSRQQDQDNRHTGAMMEDGGREAQRDRWRERDRQGGEGETERWEIKGEEETNKRR